MPCCGASMLRLSFTTLVNTRGTDSGMHTPGRWSWTWATGGGLGGWVCVDMLLVGLQIQPTYLYWRLEHGTERLLSELFGFTKAFRSFKISIGRPSLVFFVARKVGHNPLEREVIFGIWLFPIKVPWLLLAENSGELCLPVVELLELYSTREGFDVNSSL